jgi:hypothetical protein
MTSYVRDLTELTTVATNDYLLISDTSDVTNKDKRISQLNLVGANITGGGTLATGGFTVTWPATGTAVLKSGTPVAGRVASWLDANTVQDGGFAVTDIARLSQSQTFTGAPTVTGKITLAGGQLTGFYNINDQSFVQFTPILTTGLMIVLCNNSSLVSGICNYRTNSYLAALVAAANLVFTTGALNGTTGTAGKCTVSTAGTDLYIENRTGATRTFVYLLIG